VFRSLDYALWRETAHNPVRMLQLVSHETLAWAAADPAWLAGYDAAIARLDLAQARTAWFDTQYAELSDRTIAYFSAEFALHQSLPIYAGGLGVLAGDHCKEASDLGVPLVGVGFMYPQGYFHQRITSEGRQEEIYETLNWTQTAIEPAVTPDGRPCVTAVPLGNRTVLVTVWQVRVGRVLLYLLDTNL
jgi:starch phosphorylase